MPATVTQVPSNFNPSTVVDNLFRKQQDILQWVQQKKLGMIPVLDLIPTKNRPNGMAPNLQTQRYEANYLPQSAVNLKSISFPTFGANSTTDSVFTNAPVMDFGQTTLSMDGYEFATMSPMFNAEDFQTAANPEAQVANILETLAESVIWYRQTVNRKLIRKYSGRKVVANSNLDESNLLTSDIAFPTDLAGNLIIPSSNLTQSMLDILGLQLDRDAAGEGSYGMSGGANVYALLVDPYDSTGLIRNSPEIRQDYRFSEMSDELLKPYGALRTAFNFSHVIDRYRERFYVALAPVNISNITISGTVATATSTAHGLNTGDVVDLNGIALASGADWRIQTLNDIFTVTKIDANNFSFPAYFAPSTNPTTFGTFSKCGTATGVGAYYAEVDPWIFIPTTLGLRRMPNPLYNTAPFTATSVYNKKALEFYVPEQPPTLKGFKAAPQKYLGDLQIRRPNPDSDLAMTKFYWFSRLKLWAQPIRPEWLISIMHLRCNVPLLSSGC